MGDVKDKLETSDEEVSKEGVSSTPEEEKKEEKPKEEPKVPLSRVRELRDKIEDLEKELQRAKSPEIPEDEAKIRQIIEKIEKEKTELEKQEEKELEEELNQLEEIYGKFDREALLKLVDYYGIYDDEDNVNWDRAMELYNTPGIVEKVAGKKIAPVQKVPSQKRAGEEPQKETVDVSKYRDAREIAQEEIRKIQE